MSQIIPIKNAIHFVLNYAFLSLVTNRNLVEKPLKLLMPPCAFHMSSLSWQERQTPLRSCFVEPNAFSCFQLHPSCSCPNR